MYLYLETKRISEYLFSQHLFDCFCQGGSIKLEAKQSYVVVKKKPEQTTKKIIDFS